MAKFKVGDTVYCYRKKSTQLCGFEFTGRVLKVSDTGEGIEYEVSNAPQNPAVKGYKFPLLIWESEMEATNVPIK